MNPEVGEVITAYVTKYALTKGIFVVKARVCSDISPTMISQLNASFPTCYHKGEWFRTLEEARVNAEVRRQKKIKSLQKQVEKINKLQVEVIEIS